MVCRSSSVGAGDARLEPAHRVMEKHRDQGDDEAALQDKRCVIGLKAGDDHLPNPLAATVEPIVAVPILMMRDSLTPSRIKGVASGRSMPTSSCQAFIPAPRAACETESGTCCKPLTVFSNIGNRP